ncbi:MAG: PD-(D/E)XK nuclease family protein, partial [Spirochaetaceae bacterium]|nr:PD-(D/E)XK nuclease family protein [Spirochaetaceae bacterium]
DFAAGFGAAAHLAIEARLKNEPFALPPRLLSMPEFDGEESRQDAALNALETAADSFLSSPLGKRAASANWLESELPFRMLQSDGKNANNGQLVNGIIDLVFADDAGIVIVDFKSDRIEEPEVHAPQLWLYRRAALELWQPNGGGSCRVFLYYLRTGHTAELAA